LAGGVGPAPPALALVCALGFGAHGDDPTPPPAAQRWCDALPRSAHRKLERVPVSDDWFQVYRVADGVLAITEPFQFQEVISYLVVGSERALLFDTGLGIGRIRPVVEQLSRLPVTVVNSHTHFDHVGGNADFDRILAMDTAYTRANSRGFPHHVVEGEVSAAALCRPPPAGFDARNYRTRAFAPSEFIREGRRIDLGGRLVQVLHVPGHTPDAVALWEETAGFLWTGDSFYEGPIWLFVPETDWTAFATSVDRMANLVPRLKKLLPAHNVAVSDPRNLLALQEAVRAVRSGRAAGREKPDGSIEFSFGVFSILTSRRALEGEKIPPGRGGSGLPESRPGGE